MTKTFSAGEFFGSRESFLFYSSNLSSNQLTYYVIYFQFYVLS